MAEEPAQASRPAAPTCNIESVQFSESGAIFVVGWADDRNCPIIELHVDTGRGAPLSWTTLARVRRQDAEAAMGSTARHCYGFFGFALPEGPGAAPRATPSEVTAALQFEGGAMSVQTRKTALMSDTDLRDSVMTYLAQCGYFGHPMLGGFANLDAGLGDALIAYNLRISHTIRQSAQVERFGPRTGRPRCSVIVPIYGRREFFFLQACAFAGGAGIDEYEFITVCNSPELIEPLLREARINERTYGLRQSIVVLNGNAGFGAANNVAVQFAESDRLLCLNPDVFPRQADWARVHLDLIAARPAEETRLFGSTLYYDDGSLMHGGMYFEKDMVFAADPHGVSHRPVLRVEHYGKGAPVWAENYTRARTVPAVTGAFISVARAWYEKLGGFTEDYMFGHYEDADLCLKSLRAGTPAHLHDIRMWHLEGKGSNRLPPHEGGSLLNRWLFTRQWLDILDPGLLGRAPGHASFAGAAP